MNCTHGLSSFQVSQRTLEEKRVMPGNKLGNPKSKFLTTPGSVNRLFSDFFQGMVKDYSEVDVERFLGEK